MVSQRQPIWSLGLPRRKKLRAESGNLIGFASYCGVEQEGGAGAWGEKKTNYLTMNGLGIEKKIKQVKKYALGGGLVNRITLDHQFNYSPKDGGTRKKGTEKVNQRYPT